ncbi:MAG: hypothetical protein O7G84_01305 [Gammaproteobacteria bacterium]|nr:hypothetical protein [Gammaproteobacteria bacterium]
MGLPNQQLLALIETARAEADHDLVLDPLGTAGGNVFTDYGLCIAAAAALKGLVRVRLLNDVTVASGSFGAEMSRIEFIGTIATGFIPTITFTGSAQHSAIPRSMQYMGMAVAATATVVPFIPTIDILTVLDTKVVTFTTDLNSGPLFRLNAVPQLLAVIADTLVCNPDSAADPIFDMAFDGTVVEIDVSPTTLGTGSDIPPESFGGVSGVAITIKVSDPFSDIQHPRFNGSINAGAVISYESFGTAGTHFESSTASVTFRRLNGYWLPDLTSGPHTITLDFTEMTPRPGNSVEIFTDSFNGVNALTITFAGSQTFSDGSTSKVLQKPNGHWHLIERSSNTFVLVGDDGIENASQGPLRVSPTLTTTDATPTDIHSRAVAVDDDVVGVEAIVTGYDTTNNQMYKYRLSGIAKRVAGTVTLAAATTEVIVEDDAAADCVLATDGTTDVSVLITGVAGDTIAWTAEIQYTQVA